MLENTSIVITTGAELTVLATATGAVITDLWLLPPPLSGDSQPLLARQRLALWRLLGLCVMVFAAAAAVELVLRTASMSGLPLRQAYTEIDTVIFKTHYGRLWVWRAAAALALMIIWLSQRRHSAALSPPLGVLLAVIVIVVSLSAAGHGGDDGMLSTANIANTLHILGALLWGGGIVAFALVILPMLKRSPEPAQALLARSALRLSTLAGVALALTIVPGLYNAWSLVGSWQGLWSTRYGQLLIVKIILVAAMIALGAVNRYRYVPSLQIQAGHPPPHPWLPLPGFLRPSGARASGIHFLRSLRAEALVLLAILGMAAALSQEMPAAHGEHHGTAHHARVAAQ
jgi:putative copper resistance protein D